MADDFTTWLRKWWRVGRLPYEQGIVRDLTTLAAQQHEALEHTDEIHHWDCPIINKDKIRGTAILCECAERERRAARLAAEEFQERYA